MPSVDNAIGRWFANSDFWSIIKVVVAFLSHACAPAPLHSSDPDTAWSQHCPIPTPVAHPCKAAEPLEPGTASKPAEQTKNKHILR